MDKHIGSRVFILRHVRELSLKDVADAIGISYQQLQKYEKGQNRIAASTLYQLAGHFKVPIDAFYARYSLLKTRDAEPKAIIHDMKLICAIHDIADVQTRKTIIKQILPIIEALDFYYRDRRIHNKCQKMLEGEAG